MLYRSAISLYIPKLKKWTMRSQYGYMWLYCSYFTGFQTGVGEDVGVSQPTVSNIVFFVAQRIAAKANDWIHFPSTVDEMNPEKEIWLHRYNFPTAIGALDCTHIRIRNIHVHGEEYICRKNFPSINVQATCNGDELFTNVNAEWPGSVHDSRIWRNSGICCILRSFNNAVLLADQGYGIEKCLMTPYASAVTPQETAFNNLLKQERVIIERSFGQLKQRFPILQYTIRLSLARVPTVIIACFVLHNVSKFLKDDAVLDQVEYENPVDEADHDPDYADLGAHNRRQEGQVKRRQLSEVIYNLQ